MKVLVIGASGMIGSTVLRVLSDKKEWQVSGTVRSRDVRRFFPSHISERILEGVDAERPELLINVLEALQPNLVINCAGLTKHKPEVEDPLVSIPINTLLPHRLAKLCKLVGARMIHVSTDCVFAGNRGNYDEEDSADAQDMYGKSKALGEVTYAHTVTLRTSTIGHEFQTKYGLLEWFLSQEDCCKGYNRAVFSGLPTVVFARVIRDFVIPNSELSGLYHVAAEPINKYDLLKLIAKVYGKQIKIEVDNELELDRSLNADRFRAATGYTAPRWEALIKAMHAYQ